MRSQIAKNTQELTNSRVERLQLLERELPAKETQLQHYRQTLAQLEESNSHSEWQQMQSGLAHPRIATPRARISSQKCPAAPCRLGKSIPAFGGEN